MSGLDVLPDFLSNSDPVSSIGLFLHHPPNLGIRVEMVQFISRLLLKQRFLAVHHDFHRLLIATKLLSAKLHWLYVKGSGVGVGNFGKLGVGSRIFYLRLRNPDNSLLWCHHFVIWLFHGTYEYAHKQIRNQEGATEQWPHPKFLKTFWNGQELFSC